MSEIKNMNGSDEIKAVLLHLGHNMWCDYMPEDMDNQQLPFGKPDTVLRSKEDLWRRAIDRMVEQKMNMLVIDIGEALVFPSHPELAIEGSWTPEKMQEEIRRLKALGIEAIPKLNFSTTHNGWLKHYRRMVSTKEYYRVCEDVIRDTGEIFGTPRFFHIGYDEETAHHQDNSFHQFICVRKGELWKHDFLHIVGAVEKNGMRAWAWSDYGWDHQDFYEWTPKSVLMSNWYYDECYGGFELEENKTADHKRLKGFYDLEKAGFEQVPCGTNWSGWKRREVNAGADDVIGKLVKTCRRDLGPATLKGFMMAPWASCDTEDNLAYVNHGIDLFAEALKQ